MQSNVWVCCTGKSYICMCVNTEHSSLHTISLAICLVVLYKKLLLPIIHTLQLPPTIFANNGFIIFLINFYP